MASTAETNIKERLAAAPTFHPASADLFTEDWCIEPGDVVTVTSGSEAYSVPVYSLSLDWKGTCRTAIQSTGNQKRDSLTALRKKHYSGGYGGLAAQRTIINNAPAIYTQMEDPFSVAGGGHEPKEGAVWIMDDGEHTWGDMASRTWEELSADYDWRQLAGSKGMVYMNGQWEKFVDHGGEILQGTRIKKTEEEVALQAGDITGLYGQISVTAREIRSEVIDARQGLQSTISQTASEIRLDVTDKYNELSGNITVNSDKISLVVAGTGQNAYIKPAAIIAAINNGESSILISADHINLDGYVTATDLNAVQANIDNLTAGITIATALKATTMRANSSLAVGSNNSQITLDGSDRKIYADKIYLNTDVEIGNNATITTTKAQNLVTDLQITQSGNTYTLQKKTVQTDSWADIGSFSRATTLTGAWSSGTLTVTASPQGTTFTQSILLYPDTDNASDNCNVYAYHTNTSSDSNRVNSGKIYVTEIVNSKAAVIRWGGSSGNIIAHCSTQNTYDAGYTAGAKKKGTWDTSTGTYTVVTDSSGSATVSTSILLDHNSSNDSDHFSVNAYHTSKASGNIVKSASLYVTEVVNSKAAVIRWGGSSGTIVAHCSTQNTWDAGHTAGYSVSKNDISVSKSFSSTEPTDVDASLSAVAATPGWITFYVSAHGTTKTYKMELY